MELMDNSSHNPKIGRLSTHEDLSSLKLVEVLSEDSVRKTIFIYAKRIEEDGQENDAVVVFERKPILEKSIPELFSAESVICDDHMQNDLYRNVDVKFGGQENVVKTTLIYPATAKHIDKYRRRNCFFITESAEDFKTITWPFLTKDQFSLQWVYNVLEKTKEADRLIFEDTDPDTGFMLHPDLKWDGKTIENLYCMAICFRRDIPSMRALTTVHLPLLENILHKAPAALTKKYGMNPAKLRIYLHYLPSYYHFHVHFNALSYEAPGTYVGKAHLLSDVISNIKLLPDYYQKASLSYVISESDGLFKQFVSAGKVMISTAETDVVKE